MNDNNINTALIKAILETDCDTNKVAALQILNGRPNHQQEHVTQKYLTLKSVAEQLGFHPSTLWRLGVLSIGHSFGGKKRYILEEVRAFLSAKEMKLHASQS